VIHPYAQLQSEYEADVALMRPLSSRVFGIDATARRLTDPGSLARLASVSAETGIPSVVMACIGERECVFDFTKNWGQGDSLTKPSTHVPKGRPPLGPPPNDHFPVTWEYAAVDAFTVCDQLNVISVPAWTLPYACWKWEGYNGFGYRAHGVRSPYVVGGTNLQQPGKYTADGVWDPNVMDSQLGCLPVAMRMMELAPSLSFGAAVARVTAATIPPPAPPPVSVGGGLTGTKWIQSAANLILKLVPPLTVDGSFGKKTRDAVRTMQAGFGMNQTGLVDDSLCDAIDVSLAAMKPREN
jgi:lysozyme family protein